MSLDVASPEQGAPADHDSALMQVTPAPSRTVSDVMPMRHDGYAHRSTIRSKLFALLITAALHAAALLGILLYRSPAIFVAPPPEPLTVTLLPLARPAAQDKQKVQKRTAILTPPQPVPENPIIRPVLPNLISPEAASPVETPTAPISSPAPHASAAPSPLPSAVSDAPGDARDSWEGRVLARLERFKHFPATARSRREQGVATIRFRVDRQGHVLSSSIARSSGSRILDAEALATLARATPLPAIPADRPDEVELLVPIEFFLAQGR